MSCKVMNSIGILSRCLRECFNSCCHIVRFDVLPTGPLQFIQNTSAQFRSQPCNKSYSVLGPFVYPIRKMARPAASRAGSDRGSADLDTRPRADC